jgi:hypothetical protein
MRIVIKRAGSEALIQTVSKAKQVSKVLFSITTMIKRLSLLPLVRPDNKDPTIPI